MNHQDLQERILSSFASSPPPQFSVPNTNTRRPEQEARLKVEDNNVDHFIQNSNILQYSTPPNPAQRQQQQYQQEMKVELCPSYTNMNKAFTYYTGLETNPTPIQSHPAQFQRPVISNGKEFLFFIRILIQLLRRHSTQPKINDGIDTKETATTNPSPGVSRLPLQEQNQYQRSSLAQYSPSAISKRKRSSLNLYCENLNYRTMYCGNDATDSGSATYTASTAPTLTRTQQKSSSDMCRKAIQVIQNCINESRFNKQQQQRIRREVHYEYNLMYAIQSELRCVEGIDIYWNRAKCQLEKYTNGAASNSNSSSCSTIEANNWSTSNDSSSPRATKRRMNIIGSIDVNSSRRDISFDSTNINSNGEIMKGFAQGCQNNVDDDGKRRKVNSYDGNKEKGQRIVSI